MAAPNLRKYSGMPNLLQYAHDERGTPLYPRQTPGRIAGKFYYTVRASAANIAALVKSFEEASDPKEDFLQAQEYLGVMSAQFDEQQRQPSGREIAAVNALDGMDDEERAEIQNNALTLMEGEGLSANEALWESVKERLMEAREERMEFLQEVEDRFALPAEYWTSSGFWEDIGGALGTSVVTLPAFFMGGPWLGYPAVYAQIHGAKVQELERRGVTDPYMRLKGAMMSAGMQTPLEGFGELFALKRILAPKGTWGKHFVDILSSMGVEGATEFAQEYPDAFATIWAMNPSLTPQQRWDLFESRLGEITGDAIHAAAVGFFTGGITTSTGKVGMAGARSIIDAKQEAEFEAVKNRAGVLLDKMEKGQISEAESGELQGIIGMRGMKGLVNTLRRMEILDAPIESENRSAIQSTMAEQYGDEAADTLLRFYDSIARSWADRSPMREPQQFYEKVLGQVVQESYSQFMARQQDAVLQQGVNRRMLADVISEAGGAQNVSAFLQQQGWTRPDADTAQAYAVSMQEYPFPSTEETANLILNYDQTNPEAKAWYQNQQFLQKIVKDDKALNTLRWLALLSHTSRNAGTLANLRNFIRVRLQHMAGEQPAGGLVSQKTLDRVLNTERLEELFNVFTTPGGFEAGETKIKNFAENYAAYVGENPEMVEQLQSVIDIWMKRYFFPTKISPTGREQPLTPIQHGRTQDHMRRVEQILTKRTGRKWTVDEAQASLWFYIRDQYAEAELTAHQQAPYTFDEGLSIIAAQAYGQEITDDAITNAFIDYKIRDPYVRHVLDHWTDPRKGFKVARPEYQGTGKPGREYTRPGSEFRPNRIHFYSAGRQPEPQFLSDKRMRAIIDSNKLYDITADPAGYKARYRVTDRTDPRDMAAMETQIIADGYVGMQAGEVTVLFEPSRVHDMERVQLSVSPSTSKRFINQVRKSDPEAADAMEEAWQLEKEGDPQQLFALIDRQIRETLDNPLVDIHISRPAEGRWKGGKEFSIDVELDSGDPVVLRGLVAQFLKKYRQYEGYISTVTDPSELPLGQEASVAMRIDADLTPRQVTGITNLLDKHGIGGSKFISEEGIFVIHHIRKTKKTPYGMTKAAFRKAIQGVYEELSSKYNIDMRGAWFNHDVLANDWDADPEGKAYDAIIQKGKAKQTRLGLVARPEEVTGGRRSAGTYFGQRPSIFGYPTQPPAGAQPTGPAQPVAPAVEVERSEEMARLETAATLSPEERQRLQNFRDAGILPQHRTAFQPGLGLDQLPEGQTKESVEEELNRAAPGHAFRLDAFSPPGYAPSGYMFVATNPESPIAGTHISSESLEAADLQQKIQQRIQMYRAARGTAFQIGPVYHGTGADHMQFEDQYIGTGTGTALGWGHYFSDIHSIADYYMNIAKNELQGEITHFTIQGLPLIEDGRDTLEEFFATGIEREIGGVQHPSEVISMIADGRVAPLMRVIDGPGRSRLDKDQQRSLERVIGELWFRHVVTDRFGEWGINFSTEQSIIGAMVEIFESQNMDINEVRTEFGGRSAAAVEEAYEFWRNKLNFEAWWDVDWENLSTLEAQALLQEMGVEVELQAEGNAYIIEATLHKGKDPSEYDYLGWLEPLPQEQLDKIKVEFRKSLPQIQALYTDREIRMEDKKDHTLTIWRGGASHRITTAEQGRSAYLKLTELLGSMEAASQFLLRAGIDGNSAQTGALGNTMPGNIRNAWNQLYYMMLDEHNMMPPAFDAAFGWEKMLDPHQANEAMLAYIKTPDQQDAFDTYVDMVRNEWPRNYVVFTANNQNITIEGREVYQPPPDYSETPQPRGATTGLFDNQPMIMTLFETADLSTGIHEMGHMLLRELWRTRDPGYYALAEHAGVSPEQAEAGPAAWTMEQREIQAKGFEVYMMEGVSPTSRLQQVYAQMKRWLLDVYKTIKALGVEINDEVREVYDRWVTTSFELQSDPFLEVAEWLKSEDVGTSGELATPQDVEAEARRRVLGELAKERKKEEKRLRTAIREESRKHVEGLPVYALLVDIRSRGGLHKGSLEEEFGTEVVQSLIKTKPGVVSNKGVNVHEMMMEHGYENAEQMLQDIVLWQPAAQQRRDWEEKLWRQYERKQTLRYAKAYEDIIEEEIKITEEILGATPAEKMKKQIRKATGQIRPDQYRQMVEDLKRDQAVAKEAYRAGRLDEGLEMKRQLKERVAQMRQAKKDQQERAKIDRAMHRLIRKPGTILPEYHAHVVHFLSTYYKVPKTFQQTPELDLVSFLDTKYEESWWAVDTLKAMLTHAPQQKRDERGYRVPLSTEEKRIVRDIANQLATMGRDENKIITAKGKLDKAMVIQQMVDKMRETHGTPENPAESRPANERRLNWYQSMGEGRKRFMAFLQKAEFIFDGLDGWEMDGPNAQIYNWINEAYNEELELGEKVFGQMREIFEGFNGKWAKQMFQIEGVPFQLSKESMIMIALNSGNEGNVKSLFGYDWMTDEVLENILNRLTPEEQALVQNIWAIYESLWPLLNNTHKMVTGSPLRKVEGNYFPIKHDPELRWRAGEHQARKDERDMMHGTMYTRPRVEAGHRETRQGSAMPPLLKFSVITKTLQQEIHDITHTLPVRNAQAVISSKEFRNAVVDSVGLPVYQQLMPWLQHVARPQAEPANSIEKFLGRLRRNTTTVALGMKFSVAAKQTLSLTQTFDEIGFGSFIKNWTKFYANHEGAYNFVMESSVAMRQRRKQWDREIRQFMGEFDIHKSAPAKVRDAFFAMIGMMDTAATVPTWMASYEKYMGEHNNDHDKAVAYADKVVRKTQPIASPKDLAAVQRGGELQKLFTMFYTFFSVFQNRLMETAAKRRVGHMNSLEAVKAYWFILVLPAILGAAINRSIDWDDPVSWLKNIGSYGTGGMPVVRDLYSAFVSDYGYSMSPVVGFGEQVERAGNVVDKLIEGEFKPEAAAKVGIRLSGYVWGLPSNQMVVTMDGMIDLMDGNTNNPMRLLFNEKRKKGEKKKPRRR